jgi:hypothetical protein
MGDTWIGGRKLRESDGVRAAEVNVDGAGGNFLINNTAVTATAAELNVLDGSTVTAAELNELDDIASYAQSTIAVAAEAANAIAVTVTLLDAAGAAVTGTRFVRAWLSSSATTGAIATDDTITVTATTGSFLKEDTDDLLFQCVTSTTGVLVLSVAHAGDASAKYLWVQTAGFRKPKVSAVIDLA